MFRFGVPAALAVIVLLPLTAKAQVKNDDIQRAIDRGIAYLKGLQRIDGSWIPKASNDLSHLKVSTTALVALTLLECGIPKDDPVIQRAAVVVRRESLTVPSSYETSASARVVLFLDRLGDPADEPLIDGLVYWLLTGQTARGTWGRYCGAFPTSEARLVKEYLALQDEAARGRGLAANARERLAELAAELPKRIRELAAQPRRPWRDPTEDRYVYHINVQHVTQALWAGRRHGMPVDTAILAAERHFLNCQVADGFWLPGSDATNARQIPESTCSTLVLLAMGGALSKNGAKPPAPAAPKPGKPAQDPAQERLLLKRQRELNTNAGLAAVARVIVTERKTRRGPPVVVQSAHPSLVRGCNFYHFLGSLNKVGAVYNLNDLGGIDWYGWGAEIVLHNQGPDGSWYTHPPSEIGFWIDQTCNALSFLNKSNIFKDLKASR